MSYRHPLQPLALAVAWAATLALSIQARAEDKNRLEGTWLTTASFTSICDPPSSCSSNDLPPPFQVLFTFMAGRSKDEGTLIDSSEFQFTPNPVCTQDQGTWRRDGSRKFVATQFNFCFDADNGYEPAGPTKITAEFKLHNGGNEFSGRQHIEGFDPGGTLVFVADVDLDGTRMAAEAPPPAR